MSSSNRIIYLAAIAILLVWGLASLSGDAPLAGVAWGDDNAAASEDAPASDESAGSDKAAAGDQQSAEQDAGDAEPEYSSERLRGKVVWLDEAMLRLHGVEFDPDARHQQVALETADGDLHPIVKEFRGRGFWKDERLRNRPLELVVRRYRGSPFVQVIRVYTRYDSQLYEFDYWCDICAIPMFEIKDCECCQGPIRFRERLVGEDGQTRDKERNPPD